MGRVDPVVGQQNPVDRATKSRPVRCYTTRPGKRHSRSHPAAPDRPRFAGTRKRLSIADEVSRISSSG